MAAEVELLIPDPTPWEKAVEQTSAERWRDLDIGIIHRARDPWTAPGHLLNFLAFNRSVDIWSEDWGDVKKRAVIFSAPMDHRKKGTKGGLRRYLQIAGAELLTVRTPPSGYRMGRAMTDAEREAWLSQYPEIRIYRGRRRFDMNGLVLRRSFIGGRSSHGPSWLAPDDALSYAIPQAYLYDRGVETRLITIRRDVARRQEIVEQTLEIRVPKVMHGLYLGRKFIRARPLHKDDAVDRVYTIRTQQTQTVIDSTKLAIDLARPDLDPIDIRSEFVAERFVLHGLVCGRRRLGRTFLAPETATDHLFTRTRLFDPLRPLPRRSSGGAVIGRDYINIAHHNARIRVRINEKLPRRGLIIGKHLVGFIPPHIDAAYKLAMAAIRASKRLSDKILVETTTKDHVTVQNGLKVGTFKIGEMREVI